MNIHVQFFLSALYFIVFIIIPYGCSSVPTFKTRSRSNLGCSVQNQTSVVAIHYDTSGHLCTGTLMSFNWILTSAKCCVKKYHLKKYKIYSGKKDIEHALPDSTVVKKYIHPLYNEATGENDICMLMLKIFLLQSEFTTYAKFIYPQDWGGSYQPVCEVGTFLSFHGDKLQCYKLSIKSDKEKGIFNGYGKTPADYGGPFMCGEFIYGFSIHGTGLETDPVILTDLENHIPFIYAGIVKSCCKNVDNNLVSFLLFTLLSFLYNLNKIEML